MEDNTMNNRVLENSIIINRDEFYPIRSNNIIQLINDPIRIINNMNQKNI